MTKRWNTLRLAYYGAGFGVAYTLISGLPNFDPSSWQTTADFWYWLIGASIGGAIGGAGLFALVSGARNLFLRAK